MIKKLFIILMLALSPYDVYAACSWNGNIGTVASPYDDADVAACVSDASGKTGAVIIQIPATGGTVTWADNLTVNMSSGFANVTSLTIQGAGSLPTTCASATTEGFSIPTSCGSSGSTAITMDTASINVTLAAGKKFRISNLSLSGTISDTGIIQFTGSGLPSAGGGFRVDYITFRTINGRAVYSHDAGTLGGVIDHIDYIGTVQFSDWSEWTYNGNVEWVSTQNQADMVYIEDSFLKNTSGANLYMACDANNGVSVVVRYNSMIRYYLGGHDCSSVGRAVKWYEAYGNILQTDTTGGGGQPLMFIRGGSGAFYNNQLIATNSNPFYAEAGDGIEVINYRSHGTGGSVNPWINVCDNTAEKACFDTAHSPALCADDSDCGGVVGSCQNIDTNSDTTGWPCRDQIGRTTGQGLLPMLFWNNTLKIQAAAPVQIDPNVYSGDTTHIQANRDYCTDTTMPGTCGGVTTTYTPYLYPHPLRGTYGFTLGSGPPFTFTGPAIRVQ